MIDELHTSIAPFDDGRYIFFGETLFVVGVISGNTKAHLV
jgi:hypothetical protein